MPHDLKVAPDPTDPTRVDISWSARMTVGMGIVNPRPISMVPITPVMRERIQAKADAAGLTFKAYFEAYFDQMIEEANAEIDPEAPVPSSAEK